MAAIITITTAEELSDMRLDLGEDYTLGNDIDLSSISNWQPIGTQANPFTGTLDGNGHTISNLTINRPAEDNVGLFGFVNTAKSKHAPGDNSVLANPIIKNLWFADASVIGRDNVGVLVGQYTTDVGQGNDYVVVSSPYGFLCKDILLVGTVNGRDNVGGLVGKASGPPYAGHGPDAPQANIYSYLPMDCIIGLSGIISYIEVTGTGNNVGGIAGSLSAVRPYRCSARQTVSGVNNVGGIAGYISRTPAQYCYSYSNISATGYIAGGIYGYAQDRGGIERCCSRGNVKATGYHSFNYSEGETVFSKPDVGTGGLVGYWSETGIMTGCCSYGNIEGERAGGLIGTAVKGNGSPNVGECFSRGDIHGYHASGSMIGLHFAWGFANDRYGSGGLLQIREFYSTGNVTGNNSGAVIGYKGPVYDYATYQPTLYPDWEPCYKGEVKYYAPALVTNIASLTNGGLKRSLEEMKQENTYRVAWPQSNVNTEFNAIYSPWLLNSDIEVFPVLKWMHRPRTTMLSAVHSKEQGMVLGYVQASRGEGGSCTKKAYLRKRGVGSWLDAIEITTVENLDPRQGVFATDDGRVGMVANKEGKLILVASGAGTLEITETKDLGLEGIYGGLTQLGREGTRLFYYIPEANAMVRANADYGGIWGDATFAPPGMIDSGLRISFLRAKRYVNRNRAFLTFRSDGRHLILFPNDVAWNEQPPSPIPDENSPKFNYKITVLDEEDSPVENVKSTVKKPYDQPSVTQYTDANGETTFQLHIWNYWVSLEKNGYVSISEEPLDFMSAAEKTHKLQLQKGEIVFAVSDREGMVQDASVVFDGDTKQTSAAGEALFPEKPYGDYPYQVSKDTYADESGTVSINDATVSEAVMLEKLHVLRARLLSLRWFGFADEDSLYRYAADGKLSNHDAELISFMD